MSASACKAAGGQHDDTPNWLRDEALEESGVFSNSAQGEGGASFSVQSFSIDGMAAADRADIERRYEELRALITL